MQREEGGGWIIFIEGGRCIFNDIPIIRTRWPTHGGIIIISRRALIVVVVVLLFEGGIVDVVDAIINWLLLIAIIIA